MQHTYTKYDAITDTRFAISAFFEEQITSDVYAWNCPFEFETNLNSLYETY